MARKSRKNTETKEIQISIPEIQSQRKIRVGAYVRLSTDQPESDSIETQILMIRQYVESHKDMILEEVYKDDGFTGTNFTRPDFIRLLSDVRSGRIDCIIVKDFSRFGRNYVEVGYYLETVLPHLGVRFISINDRFDSNREEDRNSISVPIKHMINSMYALDVSRKISKGAELRNQLGTTKFRTNTYGYCLDRDNNKLVIDPVASRYVKLIFYWRLSGYSERKIADALQVMGIEIPIIYKQHLTNRKVMPKKAEWSDHAVRFIIQNPVYTGDTVNGKQKTRLTEKIDHKKTSEEEWYVHPNTHEPIVAREDYAEVKRRYKENGDKMKGWAVQYQEETSKYKKVFTGRVICKDCGRSMFHQNSGYIAYKCGVHNPFFSCQRNKNDPCKNRLYQDYLTAIIQDQIKNLLKFIFVQKEKIKDLRESRNEKSVLYSYEKKLVHLKKKEADYEALMTNLYKDLSEEIIDENDFKLLTSKYCEEKKSITERINELNEIVFKMKRWINSFEDLGERLAAYLSEEGYMDQLIKELVGNIYYSATSGIEIEFTCNDIIQNFTSLLEEVDDEKDSHISETVAG